VSRSAMGTANHFSFFHRHIDLTASGVAQNAIEFCAYRLSSHLRI
jgi:hypothetical protein